MNVIAKIFSLNMRPTLSDKMILIGMNSPIHTKSFPTYTERISEE